jgi:hypothetical protein
MLINYLVEFAWVSIRIFLLLVPNTDHLQQVDHYVRGCTAALNASNEWLITIGCGSQTEETAALNASNEWLVTIGCGSQTEETAALNVSNEPLVTTGCGQPDRGDSSFECLKWATHNYWLWQPVSVSTREKRFLSLLSLTRSDNEKERVHAPSLSQGYHKSGFIL